MNNNTAIQMPNRALALAMISAGCALAGQEQDGPTLNIYTPGFLRDRRLIGENPVSLKHFEEIVLECVDRKIPGSVVFFFERTKLAEDVIAAWDETADRIREHREREQMTPDDRAQLDPPKPLPTVDGPTVARVLCMHANNAAAAASLAFVNPAVCNTHAGEFKPGKASDGVTGETATGVKIGEITGKGRAWSVNLNNEDRAKLGIHPKIR